jgi:hypothetical protein
MHGAGSPFANKMVIGRYTEMEEKKKRAKGIAGTGIERQKQWERIHATSR